MYRGTKGMMHMGALNHNEIDTSSQITFNVNGKEVTCCYKEDGKSLEEIYRQYTIEKMKAEIDKLFE